MKPAASMEVDSGSAYLVDREIGKGAFGSAFLVTHKATRKQYVLKRVRLAKQSNWQRNSSIQEKELVRNHLQRAGSRSACTALRLTASPDA